MLKPSRDAQLLIPEVSCNLAKLDFLNQLFAYKGVMAIEHADFEGIERLAKVLGGEIVYDTTNNVHKGYNGTTWNNLY